MEEELFLPVLSHFENGNFWTASGGRMRYRVDPVKEGDAWTALTAQVWEGPWNLTDSTVEESVSFPLSEEGLNALRAWALDWQGRINARPARTLAEAIAARDARRAEKEAETPAPRST
ncbi:hypothetical protein [uncultured Flavonifractor sp.]|uniref:hypothetical protein n=1 Tax=uncultured Flavonifractor sp. TaxID=1193534 RepID=UPI00261D7246|nr:hypothetical protein [uncultured Flavonifractor sp.]